MIILRAINGFFQILIYLILGRAIMSWFVRPGDRLYPAYLLLVQVTEPMLGPCRKLLARFGFSSGVDFSPIVTFLLLSIANRIIISILSPILLGGNL